MSIKISIKKTITDKDVKNYVLFCNENFKINGLNKISLKNQSKQIEKSINSFKPKDKTFLYLNINPTQKLILIKIEKIQNTTEIEKIGAKFFSYIKLNSIFEVTIFNNNIKETSNKNKNFLDEFLHGAKLKSYNFDKYKSKRKNEVFNINISSDKKPLALDHNKRFDSLLEGTNLTKDLVSEPGNVLHPDEYARRLKQLTKYGLKVVVYDKNKLKKLGMNAL